jgi:plastocyanin
MEGLSLRRKRQGVIAALAIALLVAALVLTVGPSPARAANADVTIQNFAFSPATVTVNVGDTVTWTNQESGVPHTTTSDTAVWDSGTLTTGQSFSFTFTQAGTFTYHCTIHPNMTGTVIVQQAATETATTTTATATTTTPTATPTTPTATAITPRRPALPASSTPTRPSERTREVNIPWSQQSRAGYIAIRVERPGNPDLTV